MKHGAGHTSRMLSVFEGYLEAKEVQDESSYDRVREGVVIFLGTLAQHLDASGPKVAFASSFHTQLAGVDGKGIILEMEATGTGSNVCVNALARPDDAGTPAHL